MKRFALCWGVALAGFALWPGPSTGPGPAYAQEREDRTLLNWTQMRAIINEASGERALHHVLELVPYPRVRARAEYEGHFRESYTMAQFAHEYGFSNVEIESLPSPTRNWYASQAELWMVEPESRKLYDVYDVAISICSGSDSGDATAALVDVGIGARAEDYAGKDVEGKIVLGSASASVLQRLGVFERGAVGAVSYNSLWPDSQPDIILNQGISPNAPRGQKPGFGWAIAPRVGRELATRLGRGEKVVLRSIVKAETFPGRLELVHATIPGDGSTDQEVMISAHLYEGYLKQGANDDNSGCGVTLEMGRTLLRLVAEGKLPRPKRTIHFLWVPEISGTTAWLRKHEDIRKKLIADLNFDMEGLGLRQGGSFWELHRTPDTFPSFLNDVAASVMEFVANTNRERVRYRHNGYRFSLPVVAPNGSQDPFYILIEKHYGASDHVVYLNNGIPAVIFSTWPDPWYHSSQDTPDKLDATQFKRVAVVGTAAMEVLASADEEMAARVAAESLGRGAERMGQAERKALAYLADATPDAAALLVAYKEARNAVRHQAEVEKAVVRSAAALYQSPAKAQSQLLESLGALVEQRAAALANELTAFYQAQAQAQRWKVTPSESVLTDAEKQAARLYSERVSEGGFGALQQALQRLPAEERTTIEARLRKVPQHMNAELNALLARGKSVLEIRDFLSGEFEPLPLGELLDALRAQEKLGLVKFTEKP
jgi:hypothetical protein